VTLNPFIRPNNPLSKIVDSIFKKLFTTEEIINSYTTGKISIKSSDEGLCPALDTYVLISFKRILRKPFMHDM
jgi:hypothetical protein